MKHWSIVEYLHNKVKNPNIHIKGTHSYYSNAWTGSFEESVVRYHYGDEFSLSSWEPQWEIDQLYIGDYVCIGSEAIILMGGNNTHRMDWFSLYPFPEQTIESYQGKGDTKIDDGVWIGMRSIIMPGVHIGEGAVIAINSLINKDISPYTIVGGMPAKTIKKRFQDDTIQKLLNLGIYTWKQEKIEILKTFICNTDIDKLIIESKKYDLENS